MKDISISLCLVCRKPFATATHRQLCSPECLTQWRSAFLTQYNRTANPMNQPGGVYEARVRRSIEMRGTGDGRAYRKLLGRHEHRVLAAEMIGRALLRGEIVHHIDGNRLNNDPDNLAVLRNQSEHVRAHPRIKGRWCK